MTTFSRTIVALAAALFVASCDTSVATRGGDCPAASATDCRVNQQACAMEAGAPSCFDCARGTTPDPAGACVAIRGAAMTHAFPDQTVAPGEEVRRLCRSWTLDNDEELYVNGVELVQTEQSHHSNWTFVPETLFDGPDGIWPCAERGYDQLTAALMGGVLYAQSTQAEREVQQFPSGAAVRIPARARIISDIHLLNYQDVTVTGHAEMTLYTLSRSEATVILAPFHLDFHSLDIPARSTSRFSATCELDADFRATTGAGVGIHLYYALPHTHAQGRRFFMQAVGGPRDGEMLIDVTGFNGEARGRNYEPPVDLTGITGLRFGCEFDNPRSENIVWGFQDQEMCEILAFADSPVAFESRVTTHVADGMEGDMHLFTGPCSNVLIPWDGH